MCLSHFLFYCAPGLISLFLQNFPVFLERLCCGNSLVVPDEKRNKIMNTLRVAFVAVYYNNNNRKKVSEFQSLQNNVSLTSVTLCIILHLCYILSYQSYVFNIVVKDYKNLWMCKYFNFWLFLYILWNESILMLHIFSAAWIDKCRPDILISESTYATTIRDSKRCRERDFLKKVHESIERGGKVESRCYWCLR